MRKRIIALAISCLGTFAHAQAPSSARFDSLHAAATSAMARLKAYDDSVRADNGRLDSVGVGPVRLSSESGITSLASAAARQLVDSLKPRMGTSLDRLSRYSFVVKTQRWAAYRTEKPDSAIVIDVFDRAGPPLLNLRQKFDTALVSTSLRIYAPFLIFRDAAPTFTAWIANQVSLDSLTVEDWRALRLAMVSSPAAVGRRCFEGDLQSCRVALQITPAADPAREWYDENDRERIVKVTEALANSVDGAAARRCLAHEDFSCVSLLRRYPLGRLPLPFSVNTRSSIVRFAVTIGGEGAVERLLDERENPMDRVAAAARLPSDTVLARWQSRAREQRATSRDLSAEIVGASLLWTLALGALSLRSSRWR